MKLKSFNIDFNWYNGQYATPEAFTNADPAKIIDWYKNMNVSNFWTFAVTYNGYAWYDSKIAPKAVNLKSNFMQETTALGHKNNMTVFAYLCLGDNPYLISKDPSIKRVDEGMFRMPFTDWYIDYFCSLCDEALTVCDLDGIVIDWFRYPRNKRSVWIKQEQDLFTKRMGEKFIEGVEIPNDVLIEFERRCLEVAWNRIRKTIKAKGDKKIWTNQPFDFIDDPIWNGHVLMNEADYILNECPNFDFLDWIQSQAGKNTMVVQNLCGWADHNLEKVNSIDTDKYGLFGFAQADYDTCLPEEKTSKVNFDNIQTIKKMFSRR